MRRLGVPISAMAERLGRSARAVECRLSRLGLRRRAGYRAWAPSDISRALALRALGASLREVAAELGRHRGSVSSALRRSAAPAAAAPGEIEKMRSEPWSTE